MKHSTKNNLISSYYDASSKTLYNKNPYSVRFNVEKTSSNSYIIFTDIVSKGNTHFVSSNSSGELNDKFKIEIKDNNLVKIEENLIEIYTTTNENELNSFVGSFINSTDSKTTYKQKMIVNSEEDFTIYGTIQFMLPNKSKLEKTGIVIKQYNGELVIFTDQC